MYIQISVAHNFSYASLQDSFGFLLITACSKSTRLLYTVLITVRDSIPLDVPCLTVCEKELGRRLEDF